jgi:hypothetical protein
MGNPVRMIIVIVIVIAVAALAYTVLTTPDQRNAAEKVGDAIHELPKGPDKAVRQLEDRTPGQKLGDDVKDLGGDIKENTAPRRD